MKLSVLLVAGVVLVMDAHLAHQPDKNPVVLGTASLVESSMRLISERYGQSSRSPRFDACVPASTSCETVTSTTTTLWTISSNMAMIFTEISTLVSVATSSVATVLTSTYVGTDITTTTVTDIYPTWLTTTLSFVHTVLSVVNRTTTQTNMVHIAIDITQTQFVTSTLTKTATTSAAGR